MPMQAKLAEVTFFAPFSISTKNFFFFDWRNLQFLCGQRKVTQQFDAEEIEPIF